MSDKLDSTNLQGKQLKVSYVETQHVKDGVKCDIYTFINDSTKDLAVVRVDAASKTPLQRVVSGDETVELYKSGSGTLSVKDINGNTKEYVYREGDVAEEVIVKIGEEMQWCAADKPLVFYEICTPAYEDGRFEHIG